jgi:hypothetical protein
MLRWELPIDPSGGDVETFLRHYRTEVMGMNLDDANNGLVDDVEEALSLKKKHNKNKGSSDGWSDDIDFSEDDKKLDYQGLDLKSRDEKAIKEIEK